jgi:hypothetical protein
MREAKEWLIGMIRIATIQRFRGWSSSWNSDVSTGVNFCAQ